MGKGIRAAALIVSMTFRADPWRATMLVIRSPITMCSTLGTAYGLKVLVDSVLAHDMGGMWVAVGLLVAVQLLGSLAGVGSVGARATVMEKTSLLIDRTLMEAALRVPGIEHHEVPRHRDQLELLRLRRGEIGEMVDTLSHNLGMLLLNVGAVVLLARIDPLLALLPLFALPSLAGSVYTEKARVRAQEGAAESLRAARHLFDVSTRASAGMEVRVFGLGPLLLRRHHQLWRDADRHQNRATWIGSMFAAAGWLVFSLAYVAAIAYVVWLAVRGRATPGDVVMALKLAAGINDLVSWIVLMAGWLFGQLKTAGRVVWLMEYARSSARPHPDAVTAPARLRRGIEFERVTFHYPDRDTPVLRDLCLTIPAGTTIAVVGENGAGKSTLVKLLLRLYHPVAGRILVDGVDLARIDPGEWRDHLAAGFQDFARLELLAGESVGVGDLPRIADDRAIADALSRAAATSVVDDLPDGLRTPLGTSFDQGAELSGGQWQKLALGRAMMRSMPLLLILDEPTASLDAGTEHELFERYAANARRVSAATGAITVLVSHRFSTVRMADLIVVLDSGRMVECGRHEELMTTAGLYADLFTTQARGYR
jgi:ATP-binding cassette subfamily B protein